MRLTTMLASGAAMACLTLAAGAQLGDRCSSLNLRPCPLGFEYGTELNIQNMIDDMLWAGPTIQAAGAMTRHAAFRPGQDLTVVFTFAGGRYFGGGNVLGVYEITDPTNRFPVFLPERVFPGYQVILTFLRDGNVLRNGQLVASGFSSCFGLYLEVYGGTPLSGGSGDPAVLDWVHFSEDALNMNGDPQMVVYRGHDTSMLQVGNLDPWLFAEDEFLVGVEVQPLRPGPGLLPADRDYNEAVFVMQGVTTLKRPPGRLGF